ncbi:MAG TPA: FAD-linked oxidase C-terminal domain-containing protein [Candidatus Rubrimentiphilum sp.]|nr:FAD-linked oxidase C-terminal domain-containing protein [Candidatus Rubrimentiphilum sp.]
MYSTDASNYRAIPIAVVLPKDEEDVENALAICRKYEMPITSRGGGTGLAGGVSNSAVVFDFSKYMNQILEIDYEKKYAWVQPGVILDDLRNLAEKQHLTFGPDPSTHNRNTLGGMIGNNSCGTHAQMAGRTEQNIEELEILTYDGIRMRVGMTSDPELQQIIREGGRKGEIYAALLKIRDTYADEIRNRFPDIPRRVSGFPLNELLPENNFNVARALVGTEGTCVTILRAKCKLIHSPPHKALVILGFEDIATAADHVPFCDRFAPIALEAVDETLFQYMHEKSKSPHHKDELFPHGQAWLIVQFGGDSPEEAAAKADKLLTAAQVQRIELKGSKILTDPHMMQEVWEIRESGLGVTSKIPGEPDFYPGWEDSAVAPECLGDYLREFQQKMKEYGYSASLYGHFGQGCVHCSINFDLFTAEGVAKYRKFVTEMAYICVKYHGSLSGEHGDGQSRGELLPIMYGDDLVEAFWKFKSAWDPHNRMNPGKVVHPRKLDQDLRWGQDYEPWDPATHFSFQEDRHSFAYAANRCVGAGVCRKHDSGTMCPSYMATKEEMHSTRGRARLLFEMLQSGPMKGRWRNESVKEALDLCLACKGCKGECPVNVDMATYKAEFLSHYFAGKRRPLHMYAFGFMFLWAKIASLMPGVANFLTQAPPFSTLGKLVLGIAPEREIPMFADQTFREWFAERRRSLLAVPRSARNDEVILWPDTWNNYFHPQTLQAAVEVLEDAGLTVTLPPREVCCGRPLYDYGMLDRAKKQLLAILDQLRPQIRAGVPVLMLEPSCASVFRDELLNFFSEDRDARRLADQTFLLETYLLEKRHYKPPKLRRRAVVHEHCHKKAVLNANAETHIFDQMELEYQKPDTGCCGMAGAFGFEESHYDVSVKCGERVLLPKVREASPHTAVVADGFSCREQIAQLTDRQALHPVQILKMAIDDRTFDRDGKYPERRYMPDKNKKRKEIVQSGYRALSIFGALAIVAISAAVAAGRRR